MTRRYTPTIGKIWPFGGVVLWLAALAGCEGTYRHFGSSDASVASDRRNSEDRGNADTKDGEPECDSSACDVSVHTPEDAGIPRVCDAPPGPAPAEHACIECITNSDCTEPRASRCEDNRCVACRNDFDQLDCHGVTGAILGLPLNVCDDGTCVECTGTERGPCASNVCDSKAKRCTMTRANSARPCETCVSDDHCSTNGTAFCVQHSFGGVDLGYFCLPAAQAGACPGTGRPFVDLLAAPTLDSPDRALCFLRATSCPAFNDNTEPCQIDTDCGAESVGDGFCLNAPGIGLACTVGCVNPLDCPGNADCLSTGLCAL